MENINDQKAFLIKLKEIFDRLMKREQESPPKNVTQFAEMEIVNRSAEYDDCDCDCDAGDIDNY